MQDICGHGLVPNVMAKPEYNKKPRAKKALCTVYLHWLSQKADNRARKYIIS